MVIDNGYIYKPYSIVIYCSYKVIGMRLEELAREYRKNAQRILEAPFEYDHREVLKAIRILDLDLEAKLRKLASIYGGCVSCIYSKPCANAPLELTCRECELGLRQEDCGRWKRIE